MSQATRERLRAERERAELDARAAAIEELLAIGRPVDARMVSGPTDRGRGFVEAWLRALASGLALGQ